MHRARSFLRAAPLQLLALNPKRGESVFIQKGARLGRPNSIWSLARKGFLTLGAPHRMGGGRPPKGLG